MIAALVWLFSGPQGGVRVSNDMESYALEYLEQHKILNDTEEILAYYDATLTLNGTEAAILTDQRVIYHKNNETTSIALAEVEDIRHRNETLIGDIFEISSASGRTMKVEVAPLNQGKTFKNVLMKAWQRAREEQAAGNNT